MVNLHKNFIILILHCIRSACEYKIEYCSWPVESNMSSPLNGWDVVLVELQQEQVKHFLPIPDPQVFTDLDNLCSIILLIDCPGHVDFSLYHSYGRTVLSFSTTLCNCRAKVGSRLEPSNHFLSFILMSSFLVMAILSVHMLVCQKGRTKPCSGRSLEISDEIRAQLGEQFISFTNSIKWKPTGLADWKTSGLRSWLSFMRSMSTGKRTTQSQ